MGLKSRNIIRSRSDRRSNDAASTSVWVLARTHAQTGDPVVISSYLGQKDVFDQVIAQFAQAYADQNERDHARLVEAAKSGEIETKQG